MDRKTFFKSLCLSGACMCGFGAVVKALPTSESAVLADDGETVTQKWLSAVLCSVSPQMMTSELKSSIKQGALVHYKQINMDAVLADFVGNLDKFITFLEKEWNWKLNYDAGSNTLIADENKDFCVCPVIKFSKEIDTSALCYCSEGFAEKMFSVVSQKEAKAKVEASIRRGDKSCIYKIVFNS